MVAGAGAPVPPGVRGASGYLPELESLRGIAIALVYFFHLSGAVFDLPPRKSVTFPLGYLYAGHSGVSLFFILSAFLLSQPFLREARGGRRVDRRRYFARRALRILPLYYCAVAVAAVATASRPADVLRGVPYLLFLNSFQGLAVSLQPYSNVWWSLATEIQFYMVLPL
ncbi:MAG TPA: acyltransferase family protein, partial [Candidatus Binatia bacterium]|nr:acyltransferase family protein [Candidatus Binatia bacterium]